MEPDEVRIKLQQYVDNKATKWDFGVCPSHNLMEPDEVRIKLQQYVDNKATKWDFGGCGLDDERAKLVAQSLQNGPTVLELELQGNNIQDEGAEALAGALSHNTTLRQMNLCGNGIKVHGALKLAEALGVNTTLQQIDLAGNNIQDEGAEALAGALSHNTTLRQMNLCGNGIKDHGALKLAEALGVNTTLQQIDLAGNGIKDHGALKLAEALGVNTTLQQIDLADNGIGAEGAHALGAALLQNSTLLHIKLKGNGFAGDPAKALANALACNYVVHQLELDGLADVDQQRVERFCQRNKDLEEAKATRAAVAIAFENRNQPSLMAGFSSNSPNPSLGGPRIWAVEVKTDGITGHRTDGTKIHDPFDVEQMWVWAVALSPAEDGLIVYGGEEKKLFLRNILSGTSPSEHLRNTRLSTPLCGQAGIVWSVAFSPDGKHIASGSGDMTVRLWATDAPHNAPLKIFKGHNAGVFSLAFAPNGRCIASGSDDGTVRLWDRSQPSLTRTYEGHNDLVHSVAFSPNSQIVASGGWDGTVRLWSATVPSTVAALAVLQGHTDWVRCVAFSPDGRFVASICRDKTLRIWSALGGPAVEVCEGWAMDRRSVAFSHDGKSLLSGGGGDIHTTDIGNVKLHRIFEECMGVITGVAFSPDAAQLWVMSDTRVQRWQLVDGHSDGDVALRGGKGQWTDEKEVPVAFSTDGKLLASSSINTCCLWSTAEAEAKARQFTGHKKNILAVAISQDSALLASGGREGVVCVWRLNGEETSNPLSGFCGHKGDVHCVAISPDGKLVAGGGDDCVVRLWNAIDGSDNHVMKGHQERVVSVTFSPNGKHLASSSTDKTICLWDVDTKELKSSFDLPHAHGAAARVIFCRNSRFLVSSTEEAYLELWDTQRKSCPTTANMPLLTLRLPRKASNCVAFHRDGNHVAVGQGRFAVLLPLCSSGPVLEMTETELPASSLLARHQAFQWAVLNGDRARQEVLQKFDPEVELCASDLFLDRALASGKAGEVLEALQRFTHAVHACNEKRCLPQTILNQATPVKAEGMSTHPPLQNALLHERLPYKLTKLLCQTATVYPEQLLQAMTMLPLLQVQGGQITDLAWKGNTKTSLILGSSFAHAIPWEEVWKWRLQAIGKPTIAADHSIIPLPYVARPAGPGFNWRSMVPCFWRRSVPARHDQSNGAVFGPEMVTAALGPQVGDPSFLQAVVDTGAVELFNTLTVQIIVRHKWEKYGRLRFVCLFAVYLCGLTALAVFSVLSTSLSTIAFSARLALQDLPAHDISAVVFALVADCILALELGFEFRQLLVGSPQVKKADRMDEIFAQFQLQGSLWRRTWMPRAWLEPRLPAYFQDTWNYIQVTAIVLGLVAVNGWLHGAEWYNVVLALAIYLRWVGVLYFLQPFEPTGPLVRMIFAIINDMKWLVLVLLLAVLAAANAFFLLVPRPVGCAATDEATCPASPFTAVWDTLFAMFNMLILTNYNPEDFQQEPHAVLRQFLFLFTMMFVPIVLLNLLIVYMGSSYGKIASQHSMELCLLRAKLILEVERTLMTEGNMKNEDWFPAFLHVIAPKDGNRSKPQQLEEERLKQHFQEMEKKLESKLENTDHTLANMEGKLEKIQAQLQNMEGKIESAEGTLEKVMTVDHQLKELKTMLQTLVDRSTQTQSEEQGRCPSSKGNSLSVCNEDNQREAHSSDIEDDGSDSSAGNEDNRGDHCTSIKDNRSDHSAET